MERLAQHEYMPHAPATPGTERVNHDGCTAGVDTKRRLYVTRKEEGNVVAYCHNCGISGVHSGTSRFRVAHVPKAPKTVEGTLEMKHNMKDKPYDWPKEMLAWLNECGIDLTIAMKYGIVYDTDDRRIIIPKLNKSGDLVMFQSRRLYEDGTPKYLTYKVKDAYYHDALEGKVEPNTCIVVEDMLSAIRCAEAGYTAVPLFTANVTDKTMLTMVREYDTIVVWLDNDNTTVIRSSANAVRKLRALAGTKEAIMQVQTSTDPKHYTDREIIHIIDEVKHEDID